MYIRPVHAELDIPTLHAFIRKYPLGLFTTAIPHPFSSTIHTTHIPFVLDEDIGEKGTLRGHIARANPQTKSVIAASASGSNESDSDGKRFGDGQYLSDEVLVLFNAPVHHYVTPQFYVETKPATQKTVPTWDYAAVQVYGRLKVYHANNETTGAFHQKQVEDLSQYHEEKQNPQKPWKLDDAPSSYIEALKKGIAGLEIEITRIEGRFKLSQEAPDGDWQGVVDGFRAMGTEEGATMADMVEERGRNRGLGSSPSTSTSTRQGEDDGANRAQNPRPAEDVPDDTPKRSRWLFF